MPTFSLISSTTLSSNTVTWTISNIPNTYTDLYLIGRVWETDTSNSFVQDRMRCNNVSSFDYLNIATLYSGTSVSNNNNGNSSLFFNWLAGTSSGGTQGRVWEAYFWDYASTRAKPIYWQNGLGTGTSTGIRVQQAGGYFNKSTEISSLVFEAQSTAFAIGSRIDLYGILRA